MGLTISSNQRLYHIYWGSTKLTLERVRIFLLNAAAILKAATLIGWCAGQIVELTQFVTIKYCTRNLSLCTLTFAHGSVGTSSTSNE